MAINVNFLFKKEAKKIVVVVPTCYLELTASSHSIHGGSFLHFDLENQSYRHL